MTTSRKKRKLVSVTPISQELAMLVIVSRDIVLFGKRGRWRDSHKLKLSNVYNQNIHKA